jgi:hypothetical protein
MAKVRSPNYPALDLAAALKAARKALDKDNRNKMSQSALAKHLGHDSLSGPALGKIGALRAYGLVDGKGDELRITDTAVHALMGPVGSTERTGAIAILATRPKLFQDINKDFATIPSLDNLKFWLIKREFAPDAAEKAAKCYLATMRVVHGGGPEYDSSEPEPETDEDMMQTQPASSPRPATRAPQVEAVPVSGLPLRVVMNGDRLDIQASVDLAGVKKLKEMLTKYESILELMKPETNEKK